ncbi:guanylate kinase [Fusibacter sp. JL216-2]|uniref:guanylate kinase n=1 Tax=Fusibacter sp. JL216-2 TaxID=3071453 RepID=UPI003D3327DE
MKRRGLLLVVSGPSGAGKGTICKELLSRRGDDITVSISATTRSPRDGEVEGVNYFFLKKDKFKEMIEEGEFLEHAQVYDNFYGTPKKFVMDELLEGRNVLLEIDIQGAMQVREKYPEGVFVFVLPPSMKELKNRIIGRGSETAETLEKRFSSAFSEIDYIEKYDYYIINDKVDKATDTLVSIIEAESHRVVENIEELINEFKGERE